MHSACGKEAHEGGFVGDVLVEVVELVFDFGHSAEAKNSAANCLDPTG